MKEYVHIFVLFAFLLTGSILYSQSPQNDDPPEYVSDEEKLLLELTEKAKRNLFVMLKVGREVLGESPQLPSTPDQARILADATPVYASQYDSTSLIEYINRDDIYNVLDRQPGYLRIQLDNNREGWIKSTNAFLTISQTPANKAIAVLSKETSRQIEVIHRLYSGMEAIEIEFQKKYKSITAPSPQIKKIHSDFYRYLTNARTYYHINFEGITVAPQQYAQTINRFSGQLKLASGTSTFRDSYSASLSEEFKGSMKDISLMGLYRIDQTTSVNLIVDTRAEVLETPFKNNNYQLGFQKQSQSTNLNASVGLNQYKDAFRGINSYDRLQFNTRLKHKVSEKSALSFQYQFVQNNYDSPSSADYTRHQFLAGSESRSKNNNAVLFSLRGNISSSDGDQLNFIHALPSITFRKSSLTGSKDYVFSFESFSYQALQLRNSTRGSFGISSRNRLEPGLTNRHDWLFSYITYGANTTIDHAKISFRTSKNNFIHSNTFSGFGLTAKYFLNNQAASYTDLRYDAGVSGKMFTQLSFFNRLYYPEETVLTLMEANFKVGFQAGGFKIGPVLSVRGTLNFDDLKIEADGNYYRLGAFVEGTRSFKNGFQLSLNGAYDYGHVYSEEITIDPQSGMINTGEATSRNPTTIRFSLQAGYPVMNLFDLFLHADYYKIDRDNQTIVGLNPILSSDRLSFKIGFVYRYN